MTLRFRVETGLISGSLSGLPNLLDTTADPLQGTITASNQGVAQISALAGTYNYLRQEAAYSFAGKPGAVNATAGQISIASDGTLRACPAQLASDNCSNAMTGRVSVESDQATYPGALAIELGGQRIGRAVVGKLSGSTVISVDVYSAASGGFNSGSWTLQTAGAALPSTALDGEWLCSHPETTSTAGDTPSVTGRSMRHYVSIGAGLWQTDTIDTDLQITANAAAASGATANGLFSAQWASSNSSSATRTMLPLSANTFFYVGSSTPSADTGNTSGLCQRLPEQPVISTYLAASPTSTDPVMIKLADALPTQPAVGYDQIYYKQGRYRHVATGGTTSSQWQKAFDDLCEDSGMDSMRQEWHHQQLQAQ